MQERPQQDDELRQAIEEIAERTRAVLAGEAGRAVADLLQRLLDEGMPIDDVSVDVTVVHRGRRTTVPVDVRRPR